MSDVYDLPFGKDRMFSTGTWVDRLIGGWYTAGIFHAESGQPVQLTQNSSGQTFGVIFGYGTGAIPTAKVSTGLHNSKTGSGLNLFTDPAQAIKSFRPALLNSDGRAGRGVLRGLSHWQLDTSIGKETKIAERLSFTLAFDFFNIFNHPNFYDPFPNLEDPANFGAITTQIVPNPNGFPLAKTLIGREPFRLVDGFSSNL